MAVISKIEKDDLLQINPRGKEVIADVVYNDDFFQLRTYKKGDDEKNEGTKQNIQLSKKQAKKLRDYLNEFICQNI